MTRYVYLLATDQRSGFLAAVLKLILLVLSFVYMAVVLCLMAVRRLFSVRLAPKIISIGNLTVGGTGKTTLVLYIARYLASQKKSVAIVARGYKKQHDRCAGMGDEPFMLRRLLCDVPVIVDANRVRGIMRAQTEHAAEIVILDDGLQQWGIQKDLEVVVVDAQSPFGNGYLIPRGLLRQPLFTIGRADMVVINKAEPKGHYEALTQRLVALCPHALTVQARYEPKDFYSLAHPDVSIPVGSFSGKKVIAFCGIGNPSSLVQTLKETGVTVAEIIEFADHHYYTQKDIDVICAASAKHQARAIITTEKDIVRFSGTPLEVRCKEFLVLRIGVSFNNQAIIDDRLRKLSSL